MKVTYFVIIFMVLLALGFSAFAQEYNMISNWEFDDGLESWIFWDGGADADANYELDDTGMLSGDYSVRWEVIDGGSEVWYAQTYQSVPIWEGVEYFIDFLIAWEGPAELNVSFVWELAESPYTKYLQVDTVLTEFSHRVQHNFISESTDETANFKIFVGKNMDAWVWIDRVYVSDVPLEESAVDEESVPNTFSVEQNFPNPFNPFTTISFNVPETENVHLKLIDVNGRIVRERNLGVLSPGRHSYQLNAESLTSGVYFYRVETGSGLSRTRRCVLLK